MGKITLNKIKNEIKKAGTSKGKFLYLKEDSKVRVRFLSDMEDGLEVPFHDSYQMGINVPCQEEFGRDCEYCEMEGLRTRMMYIWSVYDYESKEVKLLMYAANGCSPVPALASFYESYGTLTDRDYEIKRVGKGTNTTYNVVPLDVMRFKNKKVKPLSEQAILKCIDKAYPADNSEDLEEDEDERPAKKKTNKTNKKSPLKGKMNEPEEEDWDEEETEDYDSMSARELYNLCKERDIECKPKKAKEYYIDLLEEADDLEEDEEDWDEDEEEEDWD